MFNHSVRVPRSYKIAANIVKKVSTEGGSVKTLLYDDKLRHNRTNKLYALIIKTIRHSAEIDKVFALCSLFETEKSLDPWLAKVLATELLFGRKSFPGHSKPEQTIFSYKEKFEKLCGVQHETQAVRKPRYVRINTNLLTTSDAIRAFQDDGYRFVRCTSSGYNDYLEQIQALTDHDFTQDFHIKYLFVFAPGTKLHEHDLYLENKIVLQDKATAMAVHLLAPPPGSVVLDMCAAPGMKTTQLAACMRNQGKIYAVEMNEKRYSTLCDFVEKTGSKCVETLHQDALEMRRGNYDDVEYILLDPSCSGSGMEMSVHEYFENERLSKLTSLQEKFLKHAVNAFPNAKRIVYSTCSVYPEENERVVTNVVMAARTKWRVKNVKELLKDQWNNFGSAMYGSIGSRCLYAKPDSDFTIGFFLAVLDRDQKDLEKSKQASEVGKMKKQKKHNEEQEYLEDEIKVEPTVLKKKKKSKKTGDLHVTVKEESEINVETESTKEETVISNKKKKKSQKKYKENVLVDSEITLVANGDSETKNQNKRNDEQQYLEDGINVEPIVLKKKKKSKKSVDDHVMENEELDRNVEEESTKEEAVITEKKKKKGRNIVNENDNQLDESEITVVENGDSENSKKKNKRKHKNMEALSDGNEINDESKSAKKKNKGHKSIEVETVHTNVSNNESEFAEPRKKKRKRNNVDS